MRVIYGSITVLFSPALVLVPSSHEAHADSISYATPGTVAPHSVLYGLSSGEVYGYFDLLLQKRVCESAVETSQKLAITKA